MKDGAQCAACGHVITDEPVDLSQRKPCPNCGSTARAISLQGQITVTASVSAELEFTTYPQTLLNLARSFIDQGHFDIAVVVAHMACEIAVERSISEAFVCEGVQYLEEAITDMLNGYNLANSRVLKLYCALTEDNIQAQPFWQAFIESGNRRNNIRNGNAPAFPSKAAYPHVLVSVRNI